MRDTRSGRDRWAWLAAVQLLLLAACDAGAPASTAAGEGAAAAASRGEAGDGGAFSVATFEPSAIDPLHIVDVYGYEIAVLLFDGLVGLDADGGVVPAVAERWDVSDDATTFTFHLRDDVAFHNGRTVTAEDFVHGLNRVADPGSASGVAYHGSPILGWDAVQEGTADEVEGVNAIDDGTLEIRTTEPFALLLEALVHPVFSPIPAEAAADPEFGDQPIGNGPYRMTAPWDHNERITLERYDGYHGEPGRAARIDVRMLADENTGYRELLAGNLDIATVPRSQLAAAREELGERVGAVPIASLVYLAVNVAAPPYDQVALREALSLAIDRDSIDERIFSGTRPPAAGLVPPIAGAAATDACAACRFDPEAARAALAEVSDPPQSITLLYAAGEDEAWHEAVASGWRTHLGIETGLEGMEFAAFLEALGAGTEDPHILGWVWDYPSPHAFLSPLLESASESNLTGFAEPEYDRLLAEARVATDDQERLTLLQDAERIAGRELPIIPLFFDSLVIAHSPRVDGVPVGVLGERRLGEVTVLER